MLVRNRKGSPTFISSRAIRLDFEMDSSSYATRHRLEEIVKNVPNGSDSPDPDNEEREEERISWGRFMRSLLLIIAGVFLLLVLFDKVLMPMYVKHGAVERVPAVIGLGYNQARERLEKLGFEVKR